MANSLVEFAQDLKAQAAIEQIIGAYVPDLKRKGARYLACCPFHEEKTPSFNVRPEFGSYHCFGCGAGGDVIKFIKEIEKVDFRMAVETLARHVGIPMPDFGPARSPEERDEEAQRRASVRAICTIAEKFFIDQLSSHSRGQAAREYLNARGLTDEHIERYRIGYAPPEYEAFLQEASRRGYSPELSALAGMASLRDHGGFFDRFRDRVMFPIADDQGEPIAFGGRLLEGDGPKYLNSSDTPIFRKGKLLYGMAEARPAIRDAERAIVLEGYMDWIALHSQGVGHVVAGLGTALGEDQARLLRRITPEVLLCYDGDQAGRDAMRRASDTLLRQDLMVRIVALPDKDDPDTYIRAHGRAAFEKLLDEAPPAIEHLLDEALARHPQRNPQAKRDVFERVSPLVAAIQNPVLQSAYLTQIADVLGLDVKTLRQAMLRGHRRERPDRREPPPEGESPANEEASLHPYRLECNLLRLLARNLPQRELFAELKGEMFADERLSSVFSVIDEASKHINEGGEAPPDLFSMCKAESDKHALSYIFSVEDTIAGGQIRSEQLEATDQAIITEATAMLRHKHLKRQRIRVHEQLQSQAHAPDRAHEQLKEHHLHAQAVVEHSHAFLAADPPSASTKPLGGAEGSNE